MTNLQHTKAYVEVLTVDIWLTPSPLIVDVVYGLPCLALRGIFQISEITFQRLYYKCR